MKTDYWEKLEINSIYHIYNRAIGRDNLFVSHENFDFFLKKWKTYLPYLDVYAYCLMPNHFHFLISVVPLSDDLKNHVKEQQTVKGDKFINGEIPYFEYLEDQFKRLLSSYALAFNKQQNRHGSLFQKRFKRVVIKDEYRLHYILTYIHHNPIHHHFCQDYHEWKYSSWLAYQNLTVPSLIKRENVLAWFSNDSEKALARFKEYHRDFKLDKQMLGDTLDER